jgi:hypothetical protein
MSQLRHKQTENLTTVITLVMNSLIYSLTGWEILWYSKKRYLQPHYHGSCRKNTDKLIIINKKIGFHYNSYDKKKILKLTIWLSKINSRNQN